MLFPVLLAILTGWAVAFLGTVTGIISPDGPAYLKTDLIAATPWFSLKPLMPFKWGVPDFGSATLWAGAFGMLAMALVVLGLRHVLTDEQWCCRKNLLRFPSGA